MENDASYSGWAGKTRPEPRGVEEVHTAIILVCGGPKSRFSEILTCRLGVKHVQRGGSVAVRGEGGGFRPELSESPAVTHDSRPRGHSGGGPPSEQAEEIGAALTAHQRQSPSRVSTIEPAGSR